MGALCCCLSSDYLEDYVPYQNGTLLRECPCVRCCMRWLFNSHYSANFDDVEHQDNIFPIQASTSSGGGAGGGGSVGGSTSSSSSSNSSSLDTSIPEVFQAPPTPLPYDSDPRFFLRTTGRDGLISRRDKSGMSHLNAAAGEAQPLRHSTSDGGGGTALQRRFGNGGGGGDHEELLLTQQGLKSVVASERSPLSSKAFPRVESSLSMMDDDDVCPTCLDGYSEENPRITTACGHNFHLSCIYEWMERSKRCPLCDKEMIFSESL